MRDLPKRSEIKKQKRHKVFESPIEVDLFYALQVRGMRPTTQHVVGRYRIDIAFPDIKVGIECDGKHHHQQQEYDKKRDNFLKSRGWKVFRLPGVDIYNDIDGAASRVERFVRGVAGDVYVDPSAVEDELPSFMRITNDMSEGEKKSIKKFNEKIQKEREKHEQSSGPERIRSVIAQKYSS